MNETEPKRRAWDLVEDAMVDDELERLANLTPEQLEEELKNEGIDPAETLEIVERAIAEADRLEREKKKAPPVTPAPPAKVVRLDEARATRRPIWRRTPWLMAAAMLALTIGVLASQSATIVAYFNPQPSETPHQPTPHELMAATREKAFAACAQKDFGACEAGLDEAKKTDPTGETDPRVLRARAVILRHEASVDCERMYWTKCGEKLDLAKGLDPGGEGDDEVKKMRAAIQAAPTAPTGTFGVKER